MNRRLECCRFFHYRLGRLAQRLAHFVHTEGVVGSIPTSPTRDSRSLAMWPRAFFHNRCIPIMPVQSGCGLECRGAGRMAGFRRCNLWLRANMQPEDGGAELVCRGIVRASAEYVMMSITYEGTLQIASAPNLQYLRAQRNMPQGTAGHVARRRARPSPNGNPRRPIRDGQAAYDLRPVRLHA